MLSKYAPLLGRMFVLSPESRLQRFCVKIRTDGTFENYAAKSFLGFTGGMLLTYILLMFFAIQLNFSVTGATMWCSLLGVFLTLGLAFSSRVRVLPHFFSKNGQRALVACAFVIALDGPAQNTLRNTNILSDSLACVQERLKKDIQQIAEAAKKPFLAIKEAFRKVMETIGNIVKQMKAVWISIKRICVSILRVIKSVYQWFASIVNLCNKKVGSPHQRCKRVIDGAVADCNAKLGPLFNKLCPITYVASSVCYFAKIFDLICPFMNFISDSVIGDVKKKLLTFIT